jgi:pimeloyl-ACP methyl ester carboxylesterase
MSMNEPVTFVLVHGAWHGAWCWDDLVAVMRARGQQVVAIDLPGHGENHEALTDLAGDGASLAAAVQRVDGRVVLVGHSYGGNVITQAMSHSDVAQKVAHLVYVCAIARPEGKSFSDLPKDVHAGGRLGPLIQMGEGRVATLNTSDHSAVKAAFYGDCTDAQVARAISKLTPQPMGNLSAASVVTGPSLAPATYLVCTEDYTIPVAAQRAMVADMADAGFPMHVVELSASHSPFVSMPDAVADVLGSIDMSM